VNLDQEHAGTALGSINDAAAQDCMQSIDSFAFRSTAPSEIATLAPDFLSNLP